MGRKKPSTEQILETIREAEELLGRGMKTADACRQIGISVQTYYRWRREFGSLKVDHVQRLKDLEEENARLRRAVTDLILDKLILKEATEGHI